MTKQEIFPLYVGKCKVKYQDGVRDYLAYYPILNKQVIIYYGGNPFEVNISDCQLILKRLSKMSEEDIKKCATELDLERDRVKEYLKGGDSTLLRFKTNTKIFLWVISHGYALDDSWFDGKEPIAVEEQLNANK